jgi:excisionase family DNA binding protein
VTSSGFTNSSWQGTVKRVNDRLSENRGVPGAMRDHITMIQNALRDYSRRTGITFSHAREGERPTNMESGVITNIDHSAKSGQHPNMAEPAKNPFEPFFDEIRRIVRDEIKAAANGNGHTSLLTAAQLAKALQVNKATVYEWVKAKEIPYYQAGRFIRFNLHEVLESRRNGVNNSS